MVVPFFKRTVPFERTSSFNRTAILSPGLLEDGFNLPFTISAETLLEVCVAV
jgi:hypothetical protein